MNILLIDAGNTTIDFRNYNPEKKQLTKLYRPATNSLKKWKKKTLKSNLTWTKFNFDSIVYASVVPQFDQWINQFAKQNKISIFNIKTAKKINSQKFLNLNIKEIGADFIANFYAQKWNDALIISLGTATTISQIKNGIFQGTIIIPGIQKSLTNLINSAALLKNESFNWTDLPIGQTTSSAISLGAINGHYYLIQSFIEKLKTQNSKIIFTGGNANLILQGIKEDGFEYDEELIFKGLINLIN